MNGLAVGQTVVVSDVNRGRGPRHETIARIGRKYVYLKGDRTPFEYSPWHHGDRWVANDGYRHRSFQTVEAFELWVRVDRAQAELWRFGISVDGKIAPAVVLEIREALINIVPREADSSGTDQEKLK